jgi:hypothetical protein
MAIGNAERANTSTMKQRRVYSCATCGGHVTKEPCVKSPEPEKNRKGQLVEVKFEYHGLGGWSCENCGAGHRSVTVVRDESGGKEADSASREVPVSKGRHLKISVVLENQQ